MIERWYLIVYDISHPRRLRRVHQLLKSEGYPLQNSTFLWGGTQLALEQLKQNLTRELKPATDDLRIFPVAYQWLIQFWGQPALTEDLRDTRWPAYANLQPGQWLGKVPAPLLPKTA